MENKFYSRVAAVIMAIIGQMVGITALAQRQVQVVEMQTQPDGTEIHVPKTIEVPEKSAEEVAAAKRKAATVTAEDDDLQYYLNHLPMTRAGESAVVIDLSTFKDTIRQTTLEVNQGISLKFTNGAIRRGEGIASDEPVVMISNGTAVELDKTVILSGENLQTNGPVVHVENSSLKTSAYIGNTKIGNTGWYYYPLRVDSYAHIESSSAGSKSMTLYANSPTYNSKLEIVGGIISVGLSYSGDENMVMSGGQVGETGKGTIYLEGKGGIIFSGGYVQSVRCDNADAAQDVFVTGDNVCLGDILFKQKYSKLRLSQTLSNTLFLTYHNPEIHDGLVVAVGENGYQISQKDLSLMKLGGWFTNGEVLQDVSLYKLCLEGNSVVVRKKVKDLQSDINNAPDNTETTIDLDNYGELTTGILIPKGKKIKMTGTKNVTLASNFTGDYIFRTEDDAQLDITIPGFSGYSSTSLPKYGFVAGYAESKIQVNQLGTNTLSLPNTLLAVEKGGTIDCYANISTKGVYIAAGGTMNIYSENGEVETSTTDEGGTVNITGQVKFNETFTSLGNTSLLSENITSLKELILGKYSNITFTNKWVKPVALNISFKDNDYSLDHTYIKFVSSTTMLSGFETVRFSLLDAHSAYFDDNAKQISIEEVDKAALALIDEQYNLADTRANSCASKIRELLTSIEKYFSSGSLTADERDFYLAGLEKANAALDNGEDELSKINSVRPVFYGKKSMPYQEEAIVYAKKWISEAEWAIKEVESELNSLVSSRKKTFSNTDDLQDFLNNLGKNNETTEDNPATVTIADGTVLDNIEIPEGTHVEMNIEGDSNDDLQAFIDGLVTVKYGSSLRLNGNYVVRGENTSATLLVHGTIDIYATIILEGTKTEVVHIYNGGTVNWRGNMTSGKIVNEGTLNLYSGTTEYVENRGTAQHYAGICHHIVNHETYYLKGGSINTIGTEYGYAFENYGTAHLTGGTIVSSKTLIINYVNSKTYIDGVKLDDSNATSTIISYSDFHIRGDYSPKHIVLDNGVRINFITVWTVRWHITFIDNRTTIRKVIFHSDEFDLNDDFIKFIDFDLPDGYRWYYNATENGIELRDTKVYDSDDLQAFLDRLAKSSGSASAPVILDGDNHTVDVTMDANGRFEFPGNSNVEVRNIIFRFVSTTSHKTWYIPSGSTVILNNVTLDGGEDEYGNDNAEMMVDGGQLFVNNVVFINLHLNINCTIYICSPLSSRIYLIYDNNGEIVDGTHVAEGRMGYVLTEADLDKFGYYDYYGSGKLWKFVLAGNAIELYQEISGINTLSENNHPRVYVDGVGKLNITGVSLDAQCFIYSSEGALVKAGTVAEVTASDGMLARGCYVLKVGTTTVKFVR